MGTTKLELRLKPPSQTPRPDRDAAAISRSNSRTRGINFRTVSPLVSRPSSSSRSTQESCSHADSAPDSQKGTNINGGTQPASPRDHPSHISPSSEPASPIYSANYDFALPTAADLEKLSLNDKLRLLAFKEMAVVELKDTISNLESKLYDSERDLQSLRTVIQRSLYKQLSQPQIPQPPQEEKGSLNGSQGVDRGSRGQIERPGAVSRASSQSPHGPKVTSSIAKNAKNASVEIPGPEDKSSKLWSNLSKPITFIQSIDQMLSQEFERSLIGESAYSEESSSDPGSATSSNAHDDNSQFRRLIDNKISSISGREHPEDMFQAVSNSLWGFVNDVKTNMVSTLSADPSKSNADSGKSNMSKTAHSASPGSTDVDYSVDLIEFSDGEDDAVDLSMYSSMRQKR